MIINWFESILYGFISGIAEFFPISSDAHQHILMQLFGIEKRDPLMDLLVHLALLASILFSCRTLLEQLRRELSVQHRRHRGGTRNTGARMDIILIQKAAFPMILGIILLTYITNNWQNNFLLTSVFLLINGIILFVPERMLQGNKNAGMMSAVDSVIIGVSGSLSAICGISRTGCFITSSVMCGAKRQNGYTWALLLGIPALITLSVINIISLFSQMGTVPLWGNFFSYILSAVFAFVGGCTSINLMKFMINRTSTAGYAYYSWGAAVFSFIIYLTVV